MQQQINQIKELFLAEIQQIQTAADLEQLKVKFLGKKGPVQALMKDLKSVSPDQIRSVGQEINGLKDLISSQCDSLGAGLVVREELARIESERLDVTLPGRRFLIGRQHPLIQIRDRVIGILGEMGFSVQYGPDIDSDYYNFEVLNFPPEHPARDMQDTFYLSPHMLLRTHTSNVQARVMESHQPPIRIIAPGTVYRNEAITARSHVFFHQIEAIYIDRDVSFADLLGTLDEFLNKLFGKDVQVRYRPSYFPFVEPGMEVDVSCLACAGQGCSLCKHTGWLEIGGAGMVHPEVMKNGGIDPESYSGFAWGMGLERLLMILYKGIDDIRSLTENDVRFLAQFNSLAYAK